MVYANAARKTLSFMVLSVVLSLALLTFLTSSDAPTGRVTSPGVAPQADGSSLIIFLLGIFVGALCVGTYVYLAHLEAKRKE